jgi:ribosomal protein L40E
MSEFITTMGGSGEYTQLTEHNFKRVLAGDVESVRERLVYALEKLDYRVISEQPLMAKRASGPASSCSFNILKCVKSLTVGVKALNPTSTLVTFDYEILNPFVTKGDRQTVEREAEAIVALATSLPEASVCASCGANNSSDSRFCRVCGRPNVAGEPAELEILRLTAGARVGHQSIVGGIISALAVLAIALSMIFLSSKGPKGGTILLIIGELLALVWLFYGIWKLHRTLNPKQEVKHFSPFNLPQSALRAQPSALPPHSAYASVTEGTTERLAAPERERVAVPAKPPKTDTAEMQG